MLPSPSFRNRRLHGITLIRSLLLVLWWRVSLSSSSSLLQVATEDFTVESGANGERSNQTPPSSNHSSSHSDDLEPRKSQPNNATNSSKSSAVDQNETTNTQTTTTTTTIPQPSSAPVSSTTTWKLPSAWTAPWNDSSIEDEKDYRHFDDEKTYLDLFGEVAKEFLTQRVIPSTDTECDWNWKHLRCEPFCHCALRPMLGDYHVGRSCRRRSDGPLTRFPSFNASSSSSSSSAASSPPPPPALSPCEFDGDLASPLSRAQLFLLARLQEAEPVVKSGVNWWQQQWQELLQSQQSIKAQRTLLTWFGVAQHKLYTWQSEACANVPCPPADDNDDEDSNDENITTMPTKSTAATERRPPGPWAWSQRFLCHTLPFPSKCNHSNSMLDQDSSEDSDQGKFPWPPPAEEYRVDARSETTQSTKETLPPPSTEAQQQQQKPTFHRFAGWAKRD